MLHKMAGQSVHSHLKKLRGEGRVAEDVIADAPSRWRLAAMQKGPSASLAPSAALDVERLRLRRPSGAASQLDPSQHPAPFVANSLRRHRKTYDSCFWTCDGAAGHHADRVGE